MAVCTRTRGTSNRMTPGRCSAGKASRPEASMASPQTSRQASVALAIGSLTAHWMFTVSVWPPSQ